MTETLKGSSTIEQNEVDLSWISKLLNSLEEEIRGQSSATLSSDITYLDTTKIQSAIEWDDAHEKLLQWIWHDIEVVLSYLAEQTNIDISLLNNDTIKKSLFDAFTVTNIWADPRRLLSYLSEAITNSAEPTTAAINDSINAISPIDLKEFETVSTIENSEFNELSDKFWEMFNEFSMLIFPSVKKEIQTANSRTELFQKWRKGNKFVWVILDFLWSMWGLNFKQFKESWELDRIFDSIEGGVMKNEIKSCMKRFSKLDENVSDSMELSISDDNIPNIPCLEGDNSVKNLNSKIHLWNMMNTLEEKYWNWNIQYSPDFLTKYYKGSDWKREEPVKIDGKLDTPYVKKDANSSDKQKIFEKFIEDTFISMDSSDDKMLTSLDTTDALHTYLFWECVKSRISHHNIFTKAPSIQKIQPLRQTE